MEASRHSTGLLSLTGGVTVSEVARRRAALVDPRLVGGKLHQRCRSPMCAARATRSPSTCSTSTGNPPTGLGPSSASCGPLDAGVEQDQGVTASPPSVCGCPSTVPPPSDALTQHACAFRRLGAGRHPIAAAPVGAGRSSQAVHPPRPPSAVTRSPGTVRRSDHELVLSLHGVQTGLAAVVPQRIRPTATSQLGMVTRPHGPGCADLQRMPRAVGRRQGELEASPGMLRRHWISPLVASTRKRTFPPPTTTMSWSMTLRTVPRTRALRAEQTRGDHETETA